MYSLEGTPWDDDFDGLVRAHEVDETGDRGIARERAVTRCRIRVRCSLLTAVVSEMIMNLDIHTVYRIVDPSSALRI
jgi:hypothetical protein